MKDRQNSVPPGSSEEDSPATIRELRVRVGLLQSELESLRREHAALKTSITQDVAMLARRYLDKPRHAPVRNLDGVIFGGWDAVDTQEARQSSSTDAGDEPSRDSRTA